MPNLYIEEYSGVGETHSSVIPAPKGFVKNQSVPLSSTHAETALDFSNKTIIITLRNEGSVTCYYRIESAASLAASPAVTTDRALIAGEVRDIYVSEDIRAGRVRLSAVTA